MPALALSDVDIFNLALDLLKNAPIVASTDDVPESRWFLRNYALARNAELREHPWKFAIKRKVLYPNDFILEGITATCTGAWAPFRLTENWSGDLVTIRRSTDSTTSSFGILVDEDDDILTNDNDDILIDDEAIGEFLAAGTGFISQLYDQSANGNHLVQATTTKQPVYEAEVGGHARPAASFDGTDDLMSTALGVASLMSTSTGYMIISGLIDELALDSATASSDHLLMGDATSKIGLYVRLGGTLYAVNNDGNLDVATGAVPTLTPFVIELRHESGTLYARVNAGTEFSVTSGTTTSLASILNIGDLTGAAHATNFNLFAAMIFSTIPTAAERDRLASRLMRWSAAPGAQDFGWGYRYPLPADYIRMLRISSSGAFEGRNIQHEIEQGYILTGEASQIYIRYICEFTDTTRFDPLFVEALAARMATKMAHWLTGKMGMTQAVAAAYNTAISNAKRANSLESTAERPASDEVIDQRNDAIGVR